MPKTTGYARDPKASDREAVQECLELLRTGQDHRMTLREETWRKVDKQYRGQQWSIESLDDPTATLTVVNMSFATVQTIKPYITDQEPRFYLEPFSSDATRLSAALQEVFLNRLWRHPPVGAQEALRAATFDFLKFGDGFFKGTYAINERVNDMGDPAGYAEIFVDKVSPWDIWIDPYSDGVTSARWVAHRIWLTEREALNDERFSIPSTFEFGDRAIDDDDRQNRTNTGLTEGQRWVQLVEFYDITDGVMYAFPLSMTGDASSSPAADLPWQVVEDAEILPIVQMPNYDIGDSPWHMGELEQISQLQDELNRTRSELMTHRRRNVAKTFVRKGTLDEAAEAALQSPIVNEFVEIDTQEPLQNVVQPYQQSQITSDNYGATREIKDDIREITGITEYQRGIAPEITRTATEASIMDAAANVKLGSKLTAVEEASRRMGAIILGIAREVFPETDPDEWAMFIGGQEAQRLARAAQGSQIDSAMQSGDMAAAADLSQEILPDSVTLTPTTQMFTGEYEVLVEVGSTEYRDPKAKEERLRSMFFEIAQMAPTLTQLGVNFDLNGLAKLWLESTDIIDTDSLLQGGHGVVPPGMPPMEQQMPPEAGGLPPELQVLMGGGGMPQGPALPAPEDMQQISNTGMLDTGEVAPATPETPSNAVPY